MTKYIVEPNLGLTVLIGLALGLSLFNFCPTYVYAENIMYQYFDKSGNLVISNTKTKNAKKMQLPGLNVYAIPMSLSDTIANSYTSPVTKNFSRNTLIAPKSNISFISENGDLRQQILTEELHREELMLNDSQLILNQGKNIVYNSETKNNQAYQARIKLLQDSVNEHKKNIELLNLQLHN